MQIYSMRLALEPLPARLAALRTTAELVRSLGRICDQMTQITKRRDWAKLDRTDYEFHRTIVEASQHQRLIRAYEISHPRILGRRADIARLKESPPDTTAQKHARIVDRLEKGDAPGAEKANYQHVERTMRAFQFSRGLVAMGAAFSQSKRRT